LPRISRRSTGLNGEDNAREKPWRLDPARRRGIIGKSSGADKGKAAYAKNRPQAICPEATAPTCERGVLRRFVAALTCNT
jgi:hypothetical protein